MFLTEARRIQTVISLLVFLSVGCTKPSGGGNGVGGTTGTTDPDYIYLTGNWELNGSPASGSSSPFALSGVLFEQAGTSGSHFATSTFRVQSPCFATSSVLPLDGEVQGTLYQVKSFNIEDQVVELTGQKDATSTKLSGTYAISGGCADGQHGTFLGQRYADLSGTFEGLIPLAPAKKISLAVSQDDNGTGEGTFILSGTATFSGFPCFTSGKINLGDGLISGSNLFLTLTANDASASLVHLNGSIDAAGQHINIPAVDVTGGSCSGAFGAATLTSN